MEEWGTHSPPIPVPVLSASFLFPFSVDFVLEALRRIGIYNYQAPRIVETKEQYITHLILFFMNTEKTTASQSVFVFVFSTADCCTV